MKKLSESLKHVGRYAKTILVMIIAEEIFDACATTKNQIENTVPLTNKERVLEDTDQGLNPKRREVATIHQKDDGKTYCAGSTYLGKLSDLCTEDIPMKFCIGIVEKTQGGKLKECTPPIESNQGTSSNPSLTKPKSVEIKEKSRAPENNGSKHNIFININGNSPHLTAVNPTEIVMDLRSPDKIVLDFGREIPLKKEKGHPEKDLLKFSELIIKVNDQLFLFDDDFARKFFDKNEYTNANTELIGDARDAYYLLTSKGVENQYLKSTIAKLLKSVMEILKIDHENEERSRRQESQKDLSGNAEVIAGGIVITGGGEYAGRINDAVKNLDCPLSLSIKIDLGNPGIEIDKKKWVKFPGMTVIVNGKDWAPSNLLSDIGVSEEKVVRTMISWLSDLVDKNKGKVEGKSRENLKKTGLEVYGGGKYEERIRELIKNSGLTCDKHRLVINFGNEREFGEGRGKSVVFPNMTLNVDGKVQSYAGMLSFRGTWIEQFEFTLIQELNYYCNEKDYSKKWNFE